MRWHMLDCIDVMEKGERAVGTKTWPEDLPLFQDHFPGFPVVPGVLLLEAMAQLAGKLIGYTVRLDRGDWPFPVFSMAEKVKFRRFVRPGDEVELRAFFVALRAESAVMRVEAWVDGVRHAQAEETFVFNAVPFEETGESDEVERLERAEMRRLWRECPD